MSRRSARIKKAEKAAQQTAQKTAQQAQTPNVQKTEAAMGPEIPGMVQREPGIYVAKKAKNVFAKR